MNFKRLTINEGLSQNTVFCIIQDKIGFIWIGTEDGLNKYDGYEFITYRHENDNANSLSHSQINALQEDPEGNIWIGTSAGLTKFNPSTERFTRINSSKSHAGANDFITSLQYDSYGNLWIGTYEGLKCLNYESKKIINYSFPKTAKDRPISNRVQTIFEDSDKMLWISIGNELKRINPKIKRSLPLPSILEKEINVNNNIRIITQDENGHYWFGDEALGLFWYNPEENALKNYLHQPDNTNNLPASIIRSLCSYSANEIWIGTRDGLSVFDLLSQRFTNYKYNLYDTKSLSHNSIRCIMKDKAGNLWIGTYAGGLNVIYSGGSNFAHISESKNLKPGLTHPVVSSIVHEEDGGLWIGTEGGGLNYINRKSSVYKNYVINSKQQNIVKSLAKDKKGNLWIGTYDGLSYFDVKTSKFIDYDIDEDDGRPENKQIYALSVQDDGVWLGTDGRGLKFLGPGGVMKTYLNDSEKKSTISGNIVHALLKDDKNNLWIGTDRGLSYYQKSKDSFTQYQNKANDAYSISHNTVLSLFFDSQERLWIGTKGGGLNLFDRSSGHFYAITVKDGLVNNVVHGIREDKAGNLWVSTNKGLSRIVFKNLKIPFENAQYTITNYLVEDGLQSNQFTAAVETGEDGELFFGGISGISTFFPEKIKKNTFKPKLVITDFLIRDRRVCTGSKDSPLQKSINQAERIVLSYGQAFLTFKFAALNYINSDRNQYAYKLEGFYDDDWHYAGIERTASYTNLTAGNYTLKIKAANNDGVWSDEVKEINIIVLPPWWKSWWAYLLYALVIGSLLYLFFYYSVKTAKLQNDLFLEQLVHEKDQELMQRKLSFFTSISHEIKTPLTLILAPLDKLLGMNEGNNKIQNQLMIMHRNGERLLRLINQLLDFRSFESGKMKLQVAEGNIVNFFKEILLVFEPYASQQKIRMKLIHESPDIQVWFDRDKLEKVMYNLLSNALKFTSEGGQVIIRVDTISSGLQPQVIIKVEDNGIGIPHGEFDQIFESFQQVDDKEYNQYGSGIGLAFSKELIKLHHGEITVKSTLASAQQEGYTCFTIKLPLGKESFSNDEIIVNYKNSENINRYTTVELPLTNRLIINKKKTEVVNVLDQEKLVMLIIEDNAEVLNFIASHFKMDFEIHTANNGLSGLEKALEIIPNIIISDVMMPEIDGISLCHTLKSDMLTSHIPIILLSARTALVSIMEGLGNGADDYITKPFNLNVLEMRIWNLLDSRHKLRERYRKEIHLQPRNIAITSPDEKFIEKVMNFIEKNISDPSLNVEELSKEIGMSRVTLYRKIKALTDQTAIGFIRSVRIKRAAQLLEQNKLNVNEVAYMVGFSDVDYFRSCFKEQFGYTPTAYVSSITVGNTKS